MWRGMAMSGFKCVELVQWIVQAGKVESSWETFMAPSRHVTCEDIGGRETEERIIHLVCLSQGACRCWVVNMMLDLVVEWKMSDHSTLFMEGSKEGYSFSWCGGCSLGG